MLEMAATAVALPVVTPDLKTRLHASGRAAQTPTGPGSTLRFFPGFSARRVKTSGAEINLVHAGSGPPLLLMHGAPQTHVSMRLIATELAKDYTVIVPDLRGYGDSSTPPDGENHEGYSKRAMALDQVEVMRSLGFERFAVVGHDRGARVTWRLAVEHPAAVTKAAVLDIVPLPYSRVTREFATQYFHWFFLIQPAPFPETLITNNAEFYLRSRFLRQGVAPTVFTPDAVAEYLRCFKDPATIHGTCEDYRAGASIDIDHAAEDGSKRVTCPLLVLWGERARRRPASRGSPCLPVISCPRKFPRKRWRRCWGSWVEHDSDLPVVGHGQARSRDYQVVPGTAGRPRRHRAPMVCGDAEMRDRCPRGVARRSADRVHRRCGLRVCRCIHGTRQRRVLPGRRAG
jgi:haloacetate dehalogenase